MLGKLIKHEWIGTYKIGCLMMGAMGVITFLGWLSLHAPIWKSISGMGGSVSWLDVFSVFTVLIYVMLLLCVTFGIRIYLCVRFYRTMYTDQGYLTHTLPVTKNQILVSKLLVSGLWTLLVQLAVYLSFFILLSSLMWIVAPTKYLPTDLFAAAWEILTELEELFGFGAVHFVGMWMVSSLVGAFTSMMILFGGVSLGQFMQRGRLFLGILFYILVVVGKELVISLCRSFAGTLGMYLNRNLDVRFIVDLMTAVILYAVTYFMVNRKLNLV
ncbi:MAG: hypothetical protein HFH93_07785 [Lachnospiraceae bacterium]|nr:hypothetical protein [Lachnospiraceae bacterium]